MKYLMEGESSTLTLLVNDIDRDDEPSVYHFPLHHGNQILEKEELEFLEKRGAFLLPPRTVCDALVDTFFKHVAPIMPVIDQTRFMKQYNDPENPPSILLLQAIFLAGSRACAASALKDATGTTNGASRTFFKRAKILYDSSYEEDKVVIVQALTLLNWYWEDDGRDGKTYLGDALIVRLGKKYLLLVRCCHTCCSRNWPSQKVIRFASFN